MVIAEQISQKIEIRLKCWKTIFCEEGFIKLNVNLVFGFVLSLVGKGHHTQGVIEPKRQHKSCQLESRTCIYYSNIGM